MSTLTKIRAANELKRKEAAAKEKAAKKKETKES